MAAGYVNLYIEQGTTYSTTITIDGADYVAANLSGYTANSQIRKSYYQANATASFVTTVDAANGILTLSMDAASTLAIRPGRYVYDTILRDSSNNVSRILEGIAEISPGVTR